MLKPSSLSVEQLLLKTLAALKSSPELTKEDAEWLEQLSVHLLAEFNAVREHPLPAKVA